MKRIFVSFLLIALTLIPVTATASSKENMVIIPVKSSVEEIREIRTFSGHAGYANSVSFSPDGKYALSGSWDNTLKLWDIGTGKEIRTFSGHAGYVNSVSFSPDGRYSLSGSADKTLKLWDIGTGKEIRTFSGHTSYVYSVSFSLNGRYALSGSYDNTLKLWDIETGKEIGMFKGHAGGVNSVSFSPDGRYVLSGSNDRTIKLWEIVIGGAVLTKIIATSNASTDKISDIEVEMEKKIKALFTPRGEFETTKEYEARITSAKVEEARIRKEYDARIKEITWKEERRFREERGKLYPQTLSLSLNRYDADSGGFEAEVAGNKVFIPVPREKAIEISKH